MGMRGYDGTNMSQSATAIQSITTQNWTTSAHGAAIQFATTPDNSTTRFVRMFIGGSGVGVNTIIPTNTLEVVSEAIDQKRALKISGTFNASASSFNSAVDAQITSISNGQSQYAYNSDLLAGGTEAKIYAGGRFATAAAGTGANLFGVVGNIGSLGNASATTTGYNVGHYGFVSGGNLNAGIVGRSVTTKNSATNIGGAFVGLNAGTSPIQIGVFAGLMSTDPTFVSAAILVDNGAVAAPIAIFRDNGTEIARFADGGNLGLGVTSPTAYLQIANGGTTKASLNLVSGASAPTSPNNGDIWFDGTNLFM